MGQQQTVGSNAVRRIILVFLVAALMAAMMVASAMPAMAKNSYQFGQDPPGTPVESFGPTDSSAQAVHGFDGGACVHHGKTGKTTGGDCL